MSGIVEKIKMVPKLYHASGCSTRQIEEAQNDLVLIFPEEYIEYVKAFGAISFYGTEWTGLNVDGYLNVVEATKQERDMNSDFPTDCFVVENQCIDGILVVANGEGHIFTVQYNKKEFLCESLSDYLNICLSRKK